MIQKNTKVDCRDKRMKIDGFMLKKKCHWQDPRSTTLIYCS